MAWGLQFIGNYDLKLQWQIFSTDSNVNLPVMTTFYIKSLGNYDLKMGKINWPFLNFSPYLSPFKIFPYLYHHNFIERCLRNRYIKFRGNRVCPEPKQWVSTLAPAVKLVAILAMMSLLGKYLGMHNYHNYDLKINKIGTYTYTKSP